MVGERRLQKARRVWEVLKEVLCFESRGWVALRLLRPSELHRDSLRDQWQLCYISDQ